MGIIGRDQRDSALFGEFHQVAVHPYIHFQSLVLHFEEKVSLSENVAQAVGARFRLFVLVGQQCVSHFSAKASG